MYERVAYVKDSIWTIDAIFSNRTTAEELVAALQLRRFSKVNSSNFRIKGCPQLNRSDVSIFLLSTSSHGRHHAHCSDSIWAADQSGDAGGTGPAGTSNGPAARHLCTN